MKVFIDIEANQFSEHMISIGCVCETGARFYSLIALPKKEKPTKFITNLTGITKEDLAEAPTADEVFLYIDSFLENECRKANDNHCQFYCYGNDDDRFINRTIKHMNDYRAITFAMTIAGNLINYAEEVKKYFDGFSQNPPSLKNAYNFVIQEEIEQKHNALDDALMLKTVYDKLFVLSTPADGEKVYDKSKVVDNKKNVPDYVLHWLEGNTSKWKAPTGNTGPCVIYCKASEHKVKKFSSIEEATYWAIVFNSLGSPKKNDNFDKVAAKVREAIQDGKHFLNCEWGIV